MILFSMFLACMNNLCFWQTLPLVDSWQCYRHALCRRSLRMTSSAQTPWLAQADSNQPRPEDTQWICSSELEKVQSGSLRSCFEISFRILNNFEKEELGWWRWTEQNSLESIILSCALLQHCECHLGLLMFVGVQACSISHCEAELWYSWDALTGGRSLLWDT